MPGKSAYRIVGFDWFAAFYTPVSASPKSHFMRAAAKYLTIRLMDNKSVGKLGELKTRAAALEKTIEHQDTREHLLQPVGRWLSDAEGGGPHDHPTLLRLIEDQIAHLEVLVAKYGPMLRIT